MSLLVHFNFTVTDRNGTGLFDTGLLSVTITGATDAVAVNSVFVNEGPADTTTTEEEQAHESH